MLHLRLSTGRLPLDDVTVGMTLWPRGPEKFCLMERWMSGTLQETRTLVLQSKSLTFVLPVENFFAILILLFILNVFVVIENTHNSYKTLIKSKQV